MDADQRRVVAERIHKLYLKTYAIAAPFEARLVEEVE
jgi:hypothetical protein